MNPTMSRKPDLRRILSADAGLEAIARADLRGTVLEVAGDLDGETACAVVAMAARQIAEATSDAGLGRPLSWHVSVGGSAWYVVHRQDQLVVVRGSANKSPTATLKKIANCCGA
jgi:hypothetical protein